MTIYLAIPDERQPVAAAVETLEAAQRVVEQVAAESAAFPLPAGLRWVNLAHVGYPMMWSYCTGQPGGLWEDFGQVQQIEVDGATLEQRRAAQPATHHCPRCTDQVVDLAAHLAWCREDQPGDLVVTSDNEHQDVGNIEGQGVDVDPRDDPETWAVLLVDVLTHIRRAAPSLTVSVSEYGIGIGDAMLGPVVHVDTDDSGNWRVVR